MRGTSKGQKTFGAGERTATIGGTGSMRKTWSSISNYFEVNVDLPAEDEDIWGLQVDTRRTESVEMNNLKAFSVLL
jgi:hypothetical protein